MEPSLAISYCEYRWIHPEHFNDTTAVFIYSDKVGIANFEDNDVNVVVVKNEGFAESMKKQFGLALANDP